MITLIVVAARIVIIGTLLLSAAASGRESLQHVQIESQPSGATVYVDGRLGGSRGRTPVTLKLSKGTHVLTLELAGHQTVERSLEITQSERFLFTLDKQTRFSVITVVADAQGRSTGAELLVDGISVGTVPGDIRVAVGAHTVEAHKAGVGDFRQNVGVSEGATAKIVVQFTEAALHGTLLVSADVSGAEVFLDGTQRDATPALLSDVVPGDHLIEVKKQGKSWKKNVHVSGGETIKLEAQLGAAVLPPATSAGAALKVSSNVAASTVFVDGKSVGRTPLQLEDVAPGEHVVEIKHSGYEDARQVIRVASGDRKVLSADLVALAVTTHPPPPPPVREPPREPAREPAREPVREPPAHEPAVPFDRRAMSSFSALTIDPQHFTADIGGGYIPFGQFRLTLGAVRTRRVGFDVGVEVRTTGYFTDGGAHAKLQFLKFGPVAVATDIYLGGGGGPTERNDFTFEWGLPVTLLFGDLVRFTMHPYVQAYTERNCPAVDQIKFDDSNATPAAAPGHGPLANSETIACKANDGMRTPSDGLPPPPGMMVKVGQDPRTRFVSARLMLQAVLEIAVHERATLFLLFEGDPVGPRASLSSRYSPGLPATDAQIYGRLGLTFKF